MKIKVVFDGGIEKEFISDVGVNEISELVGEKIDNKKAEELRLLGDYFLIPYNKILYIEEVKE